MQLAARRWRAEVRQEAVVDNVLVITLVFWPVVVLLCAGINMLVSRTFSWAELIFDLLIGVVAGYFLYAGAQSDAQGVVSFFFVFSHGMLALIWTLTNGFMDKPADFFWAMAGLRIGATLWAAAWDNVSVALGAKLHWAPFLFSLVVAPVKMMFALATSAIGLLIWLSGLAWAIFGKGKAGFAGGVLFTEFGPGGGGRLRNDRRLDGAHLARPHALQARAVSHPPVHLYGRLAHSLLVPGHDLGRHLRSGFEKAHREHSARLWSLG